MNLRGIWAVFRKEARENLRDRRTLMSALAFGPLFGPVLLAALVQFSVRQAEEQSEENIPLAVMHAERAPNLLGYLRARGIDIVPVELDEAGARAAVATQQHRIVLDIPEDFGARLQEGQPAPVVLYSDGSRGFERRGVGRVRALVSQYGIEIAQLRFLARGIDPISVLPIAVQEVDVSTPSGRSMLMLSMLTSLVLMSMLFGGLYLAIDATAGERERGSLEMLLTAPVPREHLIYGKIAATGLYMFISLVLTVVMFAVAMSFVGLEKLGVSANLGPAAGL
ncbi:MAG: ABC transporter permease, partial [Rhodanobacter sp.]